MPQSIQRIARGHLMLEPVGKGYSTQREGFGPPLLIVVSIAALVLLIARTGNALSVAAGARRELHNLDPALPVVRIDTVDEELGNLFVTDR
jgi:hypothetical protein